jgi:hypothetical protein
MEQKYGAAGGTTSKVKNVSTQITGQIVDEGAKQKMEEGEVSGRRERTDEDRKGEKNQQSNMKRRRQPMEKLVGSNGWYRTMS